MKSSQLIPEFAPTVPDAAAPTPPRASFAGTWIFNLLAITCIVGITAFVALSPLGADADERSSAAAGPDTPGGIDDLAVAVTNTTNPSGAGGTRGASGSTESTPAGEDELSTDAQQSGGAPEVRLVYVPAPTTTTKSPTTTKPPTTTTTTPEPRCADFATQPEAHAVFLSDPTRFAAWDGDGDGQACEDLPGAPQPTLPPTTVTTPTTPTTTVKALRCDDFATQPEAQVEYEKDPAAHPGWDNDGDGQACEDLLGGPTAIPSVADVIKPASSRYYGVHTRQAPSWMGDFDQFAQAAGKTPNMLMFFRNLADAYPTQAIDTSWARGVVPMVTLEALLPDNAGAPQPTLDDLMSPEWDAYFTEWATQAAAHGKPVVLRFGHEMNGNWYPWAEFSAGNESGDFVQTWRHIHDIFTSVGADNVIWYWSVNRIDQLSTAGKNINALYPGDDYVDWIGLSGYCRLATSGQPSNCDGTFDKTFRMTLDALQTMPGRHEYKPVVIGETAAAEGDPLRTQWTQNFFVGLKARPEVIGFVWFNDTKPNTGNDWRIQYSAEQTAAFAAGVADARYGSGKPAA